MDPFLFLADLDAYKTTIRCHAVIPSFALQRRKYVPAAKKEGMVIFVRSPDVPSIISLLTFVPFNVHQLISCRGDTTFDWGMICTSSPRFTMLGKTLNELFWAFRWLTSVHISVEFGTDDGKFVQYTSRLLYAFGNRSAGVFCYIQLCSYVDKCWRVRSSE